MLFELSYLTVPIDNFEQAKNFYVEKLGFELTEIASEYWVVSCGFVNLRLELQPITHPVTLWLETPHIGDALAYLASDQQDVIHNPQIFNRQIQAKIRDPFGHHLVLWRPLTEDEIKEAPPLPTQREWEPEAENLLQSLLKSVPVAFRASARKTAVLEAEFLARASEKVSSHDAIRGGILAAPPFMREVLKAPLHELGVDWMLFSELFEDA